MTDIVSSLKKIQIEETKFGSSISETTATKIGATVNYVIDELNDIPVTELVGTTSKRIDNPAVQTIRVYFPFDFLIKGISINYAGLSFNVASTTQTISTNLNGVGFGTGNFVLTHGGVPGGLDVSAQASSSLHTDYTAFNNGFSAVPVFSPTTAFAGDYIEVSISSGSTGNSGEAAVNLKVLGSRQIS